MHSRNRLRVHESESALRIPQNGVFRHLLQTPTKTTLSTAFVGHGFVRQSVRVRGRWLRLHTQKHRRESHSLQGNLFEFLQRVLHHMSGRRTGSGSQSVPRVRLRYHHHRGMRHVRHGKVRTHQTQLCGFVQERNGRVPPKDAQSQIRSFGHQKTEYLFQQNTQQKCFHRFRTFAFGGAEGGREELDKFHGNSPVLLRRDEEVLHSAVEVTRRSLRQRSMCSVENSFVSERQRSTRLSEHGDTGHPERHI